MEFMVHSLQLNCQYTGRQVRGNINTTDQQNPNSTLKSWETLVVDKPITYHRYLK